MTTGTADLDVWLLKLDNLQKALQSCSSTPPRRLIPAPVSGQTEQINGTRRESDSSIQDNNSYSLEQHTTFPASVLSQGTVRRKPQPPVRRTPPLKPKAWEQESRSLIPTPGQKPQPQNGRLPLARRFDVDAVDGSCERAPVLPRRMNTASRNGNQQASTFSTGHSPQPVQPPRRDNSFGKQKTVRWSSEPPSDRNSSEGLQKMVHDLEDVEVDLVNAANRCNTTKSRFYETAFHDNGDGHFPTSMKPPNTHHLHEPNDGIITPPPRFESPPLNFRPRPEPVNMGRKRLSTATPPQNTQPEPSPPINFQRSIPVATLQSEESSDYNRTIDRAIDPSSSIIRNSLTNGLPPIGNESVQSQERFSSNGLQKSFFLDRQHSPFNGDWMGNLSFWKNLQATEIVDSNINKVNENDEIQKVVLRVHQADKTTKAVYLKSKTDASEVVLALAAKNFLPISTRFAIVEKVPSMKLERCLEDDENIRNCVLSWPLHSENLIFFEERQDIYGIFEDPKTWLGNPFSDSTGRISNSMLLDILEADGANRLPSFKTYLYILQSNNQWKRRFCVLRSSGLYASKRHDSDISDLVRVTAFGDHLHLYSTSGGWSKDNTPTPFGFVLKPCSVVSMDPNLVRAFCATSEESLRSWCSLIRIILMGPRLLENYRQRLAACALNYQVPEETGASGIVFATNISNSSSLKDLVRQKYAKETCTSQDVRETSRIFTRASSIIRTRSFSQLQQKIARPGLLSYSQSSLKFSDSFGDLEASSSDLGFVSGRNDVGRCSSLFELNQPVNGCSEKSGADFKRSTTSLNFTQRLGSLLNPLRWSRKDINQPEKATTTKATTRFHRKGPAARRCDRSQFALNRRSVSPASSVFMLSTHGNGAVELTPRSILIDHDLEDQSLPVISGNRSMVCINNTANISPRCMQQNNYLLPSQMSPNAF